MVAIVKAAHDDTAGTAPTGQHKPTSMAARLVLPYWIRSTQYSPEAWHLSQRGELESGRQALEWYRHWQLLT